MYMTHDVCHQTWSFTSKNGCCIMKQGDFTIQHTSRGWKHQTSSRRRYGGKFGIAENSKWNCSFLVWAIHLCFSSVVWTIQIGQSIIKIIKITTSFKKKVVQPWAVRCLSRLSHQNSHFSSNQDINLAGCTCWGPKSWQPIAQFPQETEGKLWTTHRKSWGVPAFLSLNQFK